jgi:hypothetical protein
MSLDRTDVDVDGHIAAFGTMSAKIVGDLES